MSKGKKGMMWGEVLKWFIGIFILVVILFILFGPEELFAEIKYSMLSLGSGLFPEDGAVALGSQIPQEVDKYFNNLVNKLRSSIGVDEKCLLKIGEFKSKSGFDIVMNTGLVQLEKTGDRGITPPYNPQQIDGFQPCSIIGNSANLFYECLKNGKCTYIVGQKGRIGLKDSEIAPFLLKFGMNDVCVIYTSSDFFGSECDKIENSIDTDCLPIIEQKFPEC